MPAEPVSPVEILLVEDSPGDARLTREALGRGKFRNRVSVVADGVAALAYLRREPPYEAAPRPDLVLLDLRLPRLDGWEVLRALRADPALAGLLVAALTVSPAERALLARAGLGARHCLTKPLDPAQLLALVAEAEELALAIVRAPAAAGDRRARGEEAVAAARAGYARARRDVLEAEAAYARARAALERAGGLAGAPPAPARHFACGHADAGAPVEEGAVALTLCPACRAALGRGGAFAVDQSLLVLTGRAAPPR